MSRAIALLALLLAVPATAAVPDPDPDGPSLTIQDLTVEGRTPRDAVKAAIDDRYAQLQACWTEGLGDKAWSGTWGARVVIDGKGRAVSAVTTRSTLNVPPIEQCALQVLQTLDVDGKKIEGTAQVLLYFRPPPGRTPQPIDPTGAPTALHFQQPMGQGAKPEVIVEALTPLQDRLRGCHAEVLARNPSLSGRVTVGFDLAGDGVVSGARLIRSTLNDETAVRCVVGVIDGHAMPLDAGTGPVTMHIELRLTH